MALRLAELVFAFGAFGLALSAVGWIVGKLFNWIMGR